MHLLKTRVSGLLALGNIDRWLEVRDKLCRSLRGWPSHFGDGTQNKAYCRVDNYVTEHVRRAARTGARCKGAAIAGSHSMSLIVNSAFSASNAAPSGTRRLTNDEASLKAGWGTSARPV